MLIGLGTINYKIIIPMIYPFLYQIRRVIHLNDEKPFYEFFTNYCGYLFSGIIYLIILHRIKKKQSLLTRSKSSREESFVELTKINDSGNSSGDPKIREKTVHLISICPLIEIEKEKITSRKNKKKYLFLLLLASIYLIPMFLDSYCSSNKNINFKTSSSISLFFCIISYVLFSRILLGHKIYRHQIFSLIIIITCNVVSIVIILIGEKDNSHIAINCLLMAIILSLYAVYNTLEKKYFNTFMDSPYHLMFIVGAYSLVFIILYEALTCLFASYNEDFNGIVYQIKYNIENIKLYPLLFIADVLSAFLWVSGIHLTVYFFTPCHFIISESISQIISTLIWNSLGDRPIAIKIIIYILFAIIIFASLIYNEIIILNFWNLDLNTKKNIVKRSNHEIHQLFNDNNLMESDENAHEEIDT